MHPKDWQHPGRIKFAYLTNLETQSTLRLLQKLLFDCICDLLPQHKARQEAPPKALIEQKRVEFIAAQKTDRLERQREFNKKGIRTTKRKPKPQE